MTVTLRSRPTRPPVGQTPVSDRALTVREREVLRLLSQRLRAKEIAARLSISTHTVNEHLKNAYRKLGANNRRQAVNQAAQLGIVNREWDSQGGRKADRGGQAG